MKPLGYRPEEPAVPSRVKLSSDLQTDEQDGFIRNFKLFPTLNSEQCTKILTTVNKLIHNVYVISTLIDERAKQMDEFKGTILQSATQPERIRRLLVSFNCFNLSARLFHLNARI